MRLLNVSAPPPAQPGKADPVVPQPGKEKGRTPVERPAFPIRPSLPTG